MKSSPSIIGNEQNIPGLLGKELRQGLILGVLTFGSVVPLFVDGFTTYEISLAFAYAIAIMGLTILIGLNGQFSIGHGAFIALGGYTTGILTDQGGFNVYTTIPIAGIVCFIVGALFGLVASRLNFIGLTLVTLALGLAIPQFLKSSHLAPWTGGVQGVYLEKPEVPPWTTLNEDQWWYYVTFTFLIFLYWTASNLKNTRSGRAMIAIRENPIAARSMGVNLALYNSITFSISAFYVGIAGALMALLKDFIAPGQFDFSFSISLLIGVIIGGLGSIRGAVFAGFFMQFLPFSSIFKSGWVGGTLLILSVYFLPRGIAHLSNQLLLSFKLKLP